MLRLIRNITVFKSSFNTKGVKIIKPPNSIPKQQLIQPPLTQHKVIHPNTFNLSHQPIQQVVKQKKFPVVTIMGHVDHGKTTLIDYLRKSNIAEKQDGGITQKIGAFSIPIGDNTVTFIDTPGHQAFINMRQRGAKVTDLVVLMVSAVEGVKKQTQEVIQLLKKENIKTIVAINKLDLPQANPQQVEEQLRQVGLKIQPQGSIPVIHISAKNGTNVDLLCQLIIQETSECKADQNCLAEGTVLQASQNSQNQNTCTLIIQKGVLKIGSYIIIKEHLFKVKMMHDESGHSLEEAIPGQAVQIVGLSHIPNAGDFVFQVENETKGKFIVQKKMQQLYEQTTNKKSSQILNTTKIKIIGKKQKKLIYKGVGNILYNKYAETEQKLLNKIDQLNSIQPKTQQTIQLLANLERQLRNHKQYVSEYLISLNNQNILNVILKFADRGIQQTILMQINQIKQSVQKQTKVKLRIIRSDVGDINANDIKDADLFKAEIYSFNVSMKPQAIVMSRETKVIPKAHKLIHTFLKDIKSTLLKKKRGSIEHKEQGIAKVAEIYQLKKGKNQSIIAIGATVQNGKLLSKTKYKIIRNGECTYQNLSAMSIKSFKKEMSQVKKGQQFTIIFNEKDIKIEKDDQIVSYQ